MSYQIIIGLSNAQMDSINIIPNPADKTNPSKNKMLKEYLASVLNKAVTGPFNIRPDQVTIKQHCPHCVDGCIIGTPADLE